MPLLAATPPSLLFQRILAAIVHVVVVWVGAEGFEFILLRHSTGAAVHTVYDARQAQADNEAACEPQPHVQIAVHLLKTEVEFEIKYFY